MGECDSHVRPLNWWWWMMRPISMMFVILMMLLIPFSMLMGFWPFYPLPFTHHHHISDSHLTFLSLCERGDFPENLRILLSYAWQGLLNLDYGFFFIFFFKKLENLIFRHPRSWHVMKTCYLVFLILIYHLDMGVVFT